MNDITVDTLSTQLGLANGPVTGVVSPWSFNGWAYVALAEFIVLLIIVLINIKPKTKSINSQIKKKALSDSVDFGNIVNSAFHSTELYDRLKIKCHPDRFPNDPQKSALALELFQLISKNRNNLKELETIKKRAEKELEITF